MMVEGCLWSLGWRYSIAFVFRVLDGVGGSERWYVALRCPDNRISFLGLPRFFCYGYSRVDLGHAGDGRGLPSESGAILVMVEVWLWSLGRWLGRFVFGVLSSVEASWPASWLDASRGLSSES